MKSKEILRALVVLLFAYAAVSKLLDFGEFGRQLHNQVFPPWSADLLVYLIPLSELCAVGLLLGRRTEPAGWWLSSALMTAFTAYIALALLGAFAWVPCSCGGVLAGLGWGPHLVFNLVFLAATSGGLYLARRERSGQRRK